MPDPDVTVPRALLAAAASELRHHTAHWAAGIPTVNHLPAHDTRGAKGACAACALIAALDLYANRKENPNV
jgi:hypothetical protein